MFQSSKRSGGCYEFSFIRISQIDHLFWRVIHSSDINKLSYSSLPLHAPLDSRYGWLNLWNPDGSSLPDNSYHSASLIQKNFASVYAPSPEIFDSPSKLLVWSIAWSNGRSSVDFKGIWIICNEGPAGLRPGNWEVVRSSMLASTRYE